MLTKFAAALTVKCSKQNGVPTEKLSDYLRRVISEKGLKYRQVAERSGGRISHAAISDIISGKTKEVKVETLKALSKGLDIPEEEIFAVARGKSPEPMTPHDFVTALAALGVEQFSAYGGVQKLTLDDQQEIIAMVEAMVEQKLKRKKKK
jgi:transcriptional regulator with XRE-family HTH domain